MEGLSINAYRGIRGCWKIRRAGYERLNRPPKRKARVELAQLGPPEAHYSSAAGGGQKPRRRRLWRWRFRIRPRIRLGSPRKWLARLRDAYVKMMLSFSNSAVFGGGYGATVGYGGGFGRPPLKEYDEKMIVEIYKSVVMAQEQMVGSHQLVCYGR